MVIALFIFIGIIYLWYNVFEPTFHIITFNNKKVLVMCYWKLDSSWCYYKRVFKRLLVFKN